MEILNINHSPKFNELGYQMISDDLWQYLFQGYGDRPKMTKLDQAVIRDRLGQFGEGYELPPNIETYEGYDWQLPKLSGNLIDHIDQLADKKYGPIRQGVLDYLKVPKFYPYGQIQINSGWTRYVNLTPPSDDPFDFDEPKATWAVEQVPHPLERYMVFDVESFVKQGGGPIMAAAVADKAFYMWLHPCLTSNSIPYSHQLITLGPDKVILNHNPKFDSARVRETYEIGRQGHIWLDTMSMHIDLCGMSNQQRSLYKAWQAGKTSFPSKWAIETSANNLISVYNHHVKPMTPLTQEDKTLRSIFVAANSKDQFIRNLDDLTHYNIRDIEITHRLGTVLVPKYFRENPHIINFSGQCLLSKSFLPVRSDWKNHLLKVEQVYFGIKKEILDYLNSLTKDLATQFKSGELAWETIRNDPYYSQLDWTPGKSGPTKGLPMWYRKCKTKGITTKGQLAPLLLRMSWQNQPIIHTKKYGWVYKALPTSDNTVTLKKCPGVSMVYPDSNPHFGPGTYAKLPHKKGNHKNVGSPLGKDYIYFLDKNTLTSDDPKCLELLKKAKSISYWESIRKRCFEYLAEPLSHKGKQIGLMIEPALVAKGTTTGRCVESLWLTTCGTKPDVVGSEIKGLVQAPKGFSLVGSDVDA